jgi:hypothetical protein
MTSPLSLSNLQAGKNYYELELASRLEALKLNPGSKLFEVEVARVKRLLEATNEALAKLDRTHPEAERLHNEEVEAAKKK